MGPGQPRRAVEQGLAGGPGTLRHRISTTQLGSFPSASLHSPLRNFLRITKYIVTTRARTGVSRVLPSLSDYMTRHYWSQLMSLHLTNRELDVMAVLWERKSATVAEVLAALPEDLAYTTVLTVLRGLEAKGHVRHESEGKAFRYFPTVEPTKAGDTVLGRIIDKIYQGSREMLVARLLSDEAVSEEELRRIRRMLDERLGEVER